MNVIDLRNKSQDNHGSFQIYNFAAGIGVPRISRFSIVRDEYSTPDSSRTPHAHDQGVYLGKELRPLLVASSSGVDLSGRQIFFGRTE